MGNAGYEATKLEFKEIAANRPAKYGIPRKQIDDATFEQINCDCPRDPSGKLINHMMSNQEWADYQGLLGHYHVQKEKVDPGPAFDWEKVVGGAREFMSPQAKDANRNMLGHPPKIKYPKSASSTSSTMESK